MVFEFSKKEAGERNIRYEAKDECLTILSD